MHEIPIDREYVVDTLTDLVRIDSVNPSLVPGAPGEVEIAVYVADALNAMGLTVETHEPVPGRPSVVGLSPGDPSGRSLMLNAHTDTVGIGQMADPFSAAVRDGKLYGRGAQDMKGGLAACLGTAKALGETGVELAGSFMVAAVADEEFKSIGTADLAQRYRVDGAVVAEPTDMEICVAHNGFVWFEIETRGRAAHGSRFQDGIDAIAHMGRVIARLDAHRADLLERPGHELAGPPSLHASMVHGGTEWSVYPSLCRLSVERRLVPGETEEEAVSEMRGLVAALAAEDAAFEADVSVYFSRRPHVASRESAIVRAARAAVEEVLGEEARLCGQGGWMDSSILGASGAEAIVLGPSGGGLHTDREWVDIDSVVDLAEIFARIAITYCGVRT